MRGIVYVLHNPSIPGHVKIGTTTNMKNRLRCANTHCPSRGFAVYGQVTVTDRRALESAVHKALERYREGTTEWFRVTPATALEVLLQHSSTATIPPEKS